MFAPQDGPAVPGSSQGDIVVNSGAGAEGGDIFFWGAIKTKIYSSDACWSVRCATLTIGPRLRSTSCTLTKELSVEGKELLTVLLSP